MYLLENLAYALVQLAHNFGAVAVVGGAVFALWPMQQTEAVQRTLGRVVAAGWAVQILSGTLFGVVSYVFYSALPELNPVALSALGVKILSALAGLVVALVYLRRGTQWQLPQRQKAWRWLMLLGVLALSAAAVLRWFS